MPSSPNTKRTPGACATTAPHSDPLAALLDLVRRAARDGAEEALRTQGASAPSAPPALIDKRALAHAIGASTAKVDRLIRDGLIPSIRVGDVKRFDLAAVRAALEAQSGTAERVIAPSGTPEKPARLAGVRLLSRGSR